MPAAPRRAARACAEAARGGPGRLSRGSRPARRSRRRRGAASAVHGRRPAPPAAVPGGRRRRPPHRGHGKDAAPAPAAGGRPREGVGGAPAPRRFRFRVPLRRAAPGGCQRRRGLRGGGAALVYAGRGEDGSAAPAARSLAVMRAAGAAPGRPLPFPRPGSGCPPLGLCSAAPARSGCGRPTRCAGGSSALPEVGF